MAITAYLASNSDYIKDLAAANIAITDENTDFPETNLQSLQAAQTTRTTSKTSIKFQFDLGSAIALQTFAVINHNFSGGTFDINSYTAADYSTGKTAVQASVAYRAHDTFWYESSAPTARQYWEFDFSSCTSADSYFEIGRLMACGAPVSLTYAPDEQEGRGWRYRNVENETACGAWWSHKLVAGQESFAMNWARQTGTTLATEMRALWTATSGGADPMLWIPSLTGTECYYVYVDDQGVTYSTFGGTVQTGGVTLRLVEAVRGKA